MIQYLRGRQGGRMTTRRLDQQVVERGLAESREQAQRLIRAGAVRVDGRPADKPGHRFPLDAEIARLAEARFVGRGGEKLEEAFRRFPLDVAGRICLDVGASTGGFTDALLQHGAARVYAVDVGRGQLHPRLAGDPRVCVMDRCNARHLTPDRFPEPPSFAAVDVSFISLRLVFPAVREVLQPGGGIVTLIKPQFEVGRREVGRGGVVRDEAARQRAVEGIQAFGTETLGLRWLGCCPSPLRGPAGNVEFLAHWEKPA